MTFNDHEPVYLQIANDLKAQIAFGGLRPGDQLPSIKEQATKLRVNPNTIAHVYSVLEQEGVLTKQKGLGTFVSYKPYLAQNLHKDIASKSLARFESEMRGLGFTPEAIIEELKRYFALE